MNSETGANDASTNRRVINRRRFIEFSSSGAIATIAGYSSAGRSSSQEEVTVKYAGTSADKKNADALQKALHEAGLPEHISVEFLAISDISDDIQAQYRQWLTAGRSTPDILRMDNGWTRPFIARGELLNLNEYLSDEGLTRLNDDYFQSIVDTSRGADGAHYGIPYNIGFPTIQYRKDLANQAGYDPDGNNWDTEPMSWQRFSEVIADIRDQSGTQHGYAWQGNNYEGLACCTFNEFMTSFGGAYFGGRENLFGPIGERPVTVTEDPVVDAVRLGRALIHGSEDDHALDGYQAISPESVLQWTEGSTMSLFLEGDAVAHRYWPSGVYMAGEEFGDKMGVMPIPYGVTPENAKYDGTGGTASALGGWNLTVNPNSENIDPAVQVLEAMLKPEFREFQFRNLEYIVPDRTVLTSDSAKEVPIWGPHLDTLGVAGDNTIPRPATVVWPDESKAIASHVNNSFSQQVEPTSAMSDLKSALTDIENSI